MEKREVVHVKEKLSPRFEASSIMKAFDGDPVLFFDKVKSHKTKIVTNARAYLRGRGFSQLKA